MKLISGPAIAELHAGRTRKWAHEHLRAGTFGPVIMRGGILYADLANVERCAGETFSEAQLASAAAGRLGRILTIPETQEAA